MNRYQEVVDLLDEAVGGSVAMVGAHGAFWRNQSKTDFIALTVFGQKLLVVGDGPGSNIVKALRGLLPFGADVGTVGAAFRRMPAGRPPIPSNKVDIIEKWINDGCPD